jgi:signal transduction histidine kinase
LVRLGVFLIVVRLLSYFLQDQARLVQAVTQSTTELRKEIDERKGTEHAILEMLDEQRRQIAYELHDGLAQALTGMAFKAKLLHEDLQTIAPEHAATMGDMERHLNEAVGQTRNLARGLDPVEVEANELIAALRKLAADTESTFRICCDLKSNAQKLAVEPEIGRHLYRIAQQAIDNAIRHGAARRISMELHKTGRDLSVIIKDDGIGFEAGAQPNVGLGLRIMRFRSDLVGGRVKISSTPGAGTCVECIVPNLPLTPGKERLPR